MNPEGSQATGFENLFIFLLGPSSPSDIVTSYELFERWGLSPFCELELSKFWGHHVRLNKYLGNE